MRTGYPAEDREGRFSYAHCRTWPDEEDDEVDSVVQPDLLVVCDPSKVGSNYTRGAPEGPVFAIEVEELFAERRRA